MKGTIRAEWESYRKLLPLGVGATPLRETRRAFYAGCTALMSMLQRDFDPGEEPTKADEAWLDSVQRELFVFCDSIGTPKEGENPS